MFINTLTPTSDQGRISPFIVLRIKTNINQGIISRSNTKFSKLILYGMADSKENFIKDPRSEGVNQ